MNDDEINQMLTNELIWVLRKFEPIIKESLLNSGDHWPLFAWNLLYPWTHENPAL